LSYRGTALDDLDLILLRGAAISPISYLISLSLQYCSKKKIGPFGGGFTPTKLSVRGIGSGNFSVF
jgi:hypothetical protein